MRALLVRHTEFMKDVVGQLWLAILTQSLFVKKNTILKLKLIFKGEVSSILGSKDKSKSTTVDILVVIQTTILYISVYFPRCPNPRSLRRAALIILVVIPFYL